MHMQLEQPRLDRLPEIIAQMMKPAEKIDSIRIEFITDGGTMLARFLAGAADLAAALTPPPAAANNRPLVAPARSLLSSHLTNAGPG